MSYTPTTWTTGDTVTATAMNKIEQGIAGAGGGYDAVIRLTHSNDSGADTPSNLTPSIVSGTFSHLYAILDDNDVPDIRVEYYHPWGKLTTLTPYISYFNDATIFILITGYLPVDAEFNVIDTALIWDSNDDIVWD